MTVSQDRFVRNPPPNGYFYDTQDELDWYGSNPEGIDRDRTPNSYYTDEEILVVPEKEEDSDSEGEWSRSIYSDASRSPSLRSPKFESVSPSSFTLKRKVETFLDDDEVIQKQEQEQEQKPRRRKGIKRRKIAPAVTSEGRGGTRGVD